MMDRNTCVRRLKSFSRRLALLALVVLAASTMASCGRRSGGVAAGTPPAQSASTTTSEHTRSQGSASAVDEEASAGQVGKAALMEGLGDSGTIPVVIVPGIAGTELACTEPSGDQVLLWPPLDTGSESWRKVHDAGSLFSAYGEALARLERLSLGAAGAGGRGWKIDALRAGGGELPFTAVIGTGDAYGRLYAALERTRGAGGVYFFGYDWRRSNLDSAAELSRYIADIRARSSTRKVDIVAHSMGGLVVSALLARPEARSVVRRVVLAGSPLQGSADAYRVFSGEERIAGSVLDFGNLLSIGTEGAAPAPEQDSAPGLLSRAFELGVTRLLPDYSSIYELMTDKDFARARAQARRIPGPRAASAGQAVVRAAAFRSSTTARLGGIYRGADVRALVGTSHMLPDGDGLYVDGDGLVSARSAVAGELLKAKAGYFPLDHLALVEDPAALAWITGQLEQR